MERIINFIHSIHPTFITIHPSTTIYYQFKFIKFCLVLMAHALAFAMFGEALGMTLLHTTSDL
jgi:hypothetical protein